MDNAANVEKTNLLVNRWEMLEDVEWDGRCGSNRKSLYLNELVRIGVRLVKLGGVFLDLVA